MLEQCSLVCRKCRGVRFFFQSKDIIYFCLFSDYTCRLPLIAMVITAPSHLPMVATSQVAAESESMVAVPINQEQQQSDHQDPQTDSYVWRVILSPALNRLRSLLEYLKVQLGISVANCRVGSLMITVTCSSRHILEGLWKDYSSGHLNKVVQQTLVTPDVLKKLGLSELKLKTTISEEEYNKYKEFLSSESKVRVAENFSL